MMMYIFWLLWSLTAGTYFCKCKHDRPFFDVAPGSALVAFVQINRYHYVNDFPRAIDVEILKTLYGKEKKKYIRIWSDDGKMCRPYATRFPLRSSWAMALDLNHEEGESGYELSICGAYWLPVSADSVSGRIDSDTSQTWSRKSFEEKLAAVMKGVE